MAENEKKIVEWCESKVGCGYIYGASGQICNAAFRQQQAKQYPSQESYIMGTGAKWDGVTVYDCAQLTRKAMAQAGVSMVSGATSQWKKTEWQEKGEIAQMPTDRVCLVYRADGAVMQHTGVYCGNGYVIHAKGTAYGVVKQKLGEYNWTHYGIPKYGAEQENERNEQTMEIIATAIVNDSLNVRKSPSKGAERVGKLSKGDTVTIVEDGIEWCGISYNGGKAYVMREFLTVNGEEKQNGTDDIKVLFERLRNDLNALLDKYESTL